LSQPAVLCLHGFTGTPFEVQPLDDRLMAAGFLTSTPLLAGHGGDAGTMEATRWPDWLDSADAAFCELAARTAGPISVLGFSMGGLLALKLALRYPERVSALAILSAPLRLRPSQVRGIRWLGYVPSPLRVGPLRAIPKLRGSDVSDVAVRNANPCLPVMPLQSLESLLLLMADVRGQLRHIRAPTLVMHARLDHTVPIADGFELAGGLGSGVVERRWLDRSFHLIGVDVEREIVADAVTHFLGRHMRG
jgi:carboxylesterase